MLILTSCEKEVERKTVLAKSNFNLKTDLTDFKRKMTDLDTIKIWFNHSVCTYQGAERIEITKRTDTLKIRTEFKEGAFNESSKWKFVYEKRIAITDTIWAIEEFFKRNAELQKSKNKEFLMLQVSHNGMKLDYFIDGLGNLNRLMIDFFQTMKKLHPENTNDMYSVEIEIIEEN